MTGAPSHILLVDDEEANRDMLARRLTRNGYKVTCAEDGMKALLAIEGGSFDLVLLDYMMPAMSGPDVLKSVRQTHSASDLPVIMVTAESDSKRIVEALELGANDYLVKPIDFGVALARMQTQLARKRTEEALRESEARFSLAANGTNDGIWDWDLHTNQVYYSPRWRAMLGLDVQELSADPCEWFDRIHPDDRASTEAAIRKHLDGETPFLEVEHKIRHQNGSYRWMLARGLATHRGNGPRLRIAGSLTDITTAKASDPLTGLPNRLQFLDRLQQTILETRNAEKGGDLATHCAVIFLDLDRFKLVNDSLGHLIGDRLLVAITRRLQSVIRSSDVVVRLGGAQTVARFGGDEFAILLGGLTEPFLVSTIAERVMEEFSAPFQLGEIEVYTTASMGIAVSGTGYEAEVAAQAEAMLRDADTAMYRAKAAGKNRFEIFDVHMRAETVARLRLETDLRRTIERGGFSLVYQPIFSLATNRIESVEALVRWNDSDGTPVCPQVFIALAEETNLVVDIGKWVLSEACRQTALWNQFLPGCRDLSLHVNVSCKELLQRGFAEQVAATLDGAGLAASSLKLEITESVIMDNPELAAETLRELKRKSIGLSIDDFGTGYSSLSYLSRLPIDSLKVDRSFVAKLGDGGSNSHIVKAIVDLAHALHLVVIAEGIETTAQLDSLKQMGCEYGQGFLRAKPLSPGAFEDLFRKKS